MLREVVGYKNKLISSTSNTKILGIIIENSLSQKANVDQLIRKLCTACYAIREGKPLKSLDTLKVVHYSYFHSLMNYGIIFWGNSSQCIHVSGLQKRVLDLSPSQDLETLAENYSNIKILPFQSQYIFSLLIFVVHNKDQYKLNSDIHSNNTRQNSSLYQPLSNFLTHHTGVCYFGNGILIISLLTKNLSHSVNNLGLP